MAKYRVYEIASAAYLVGEYEADSKEQAEEMADADPQNGPPCLCWQCADEVELGDFYKYETDEVEAK